MIDAYSRRVLATYPTFDPPSYRSCMMVLRESVRRYNRLSQVVVVDGGKEFESTYFEALLANHQCTKKKRPAAKPRFGSLCERLFGVSNTQFLHNLRGNTQIMRNVRAVEQTLRFRRPLAVLLDEAQHLASVGSGRRLSDQLDVIKSIANCTGTAHVLLGTYSLLAFRNLSAQLSRRRVDIHFPRYRSDNPEDLKTFKTVLHSFELHLPLSEPPDLVSEWEYLYERSIGCVGVLKEWLVRALTGVLRKNANRLALRDLEAHALSVAQCDKMLAEALEGEMRLVESSGERALLRNRLGLSVHEARHEDATADQGVHEAETPLPRKQRRTPGQRRPIRDAVACSLGTYGTSPAV